MELRYIKFKGYKTDSFSAFLLALMFGQLNTLARKVSNSSFVIIMHLTEDN